MNTKYQYKHLQKANMKKILILFLLGCLCLNTKANISGAKPPEPAKPAEPTKPADKDRFITPLYGEWEGKVNYEYFENVTSTKKYSKALKIELNPTEIYFYYKDEKGEWVRLGNRYLNSFKFFFEKNTVSGYFLKSGQDEDGIWVESQTFFLTLKDENNILIYSMRSVNNTSIKDSVPGTKWNETGVGELKKARRLGSNAQHTQHRTSKPQQRIKNPKLHFKLLV